MAFPSLAPLHQQQASSSYEAMDPLSANADRDSSGVTPPGEDDNRAHQEPASHPPFDNFDDDDDDDPTLWIDIDLDDTSSNGISRRDDSSHAVTLLRTLRRRRSSSSSSSCIKVQIPEFVCNLVASVLDLTTAAFEIWAEVLTAPPFPLETLHKVSIVLLGVEKIRDSLDQSALIVFVNPDGTPLSGPPGNWTLASIPHYLIWGIPGLIALLSISFVLTLQLSWGHQEEAVIATALILLIFLEALLPLFILGCTSMFLFQQVSWETGLVLLVVVWLGSTFCAHCIRRMLYQSLGHG